MAFDFPNTPTIGERWPDPAIAGQPQYQWNGTEWTAAVFDPAGYVKRTGDTMTGALSLSGDPTQALHAVPKQYIDAQRQRISLAGVKSFDIQVPTSAKLARVIGCVHAATLTQMPLIFQISVQPGVFKTAAADYVMYGFSHTTFTSPNNVGSAHGDVTRGGFVAVAAHSSVVVPAMFEGTIQLTRSLTTNLYKASFQSTYWISENYTAFFSNWTQATSNIGLNILALRLMTTSPDNWAAESYLHIEWI